jgi:hypothetical protein
LFHFEKESMTVTITEIRRRVGDVGLKVLRRLRRRSEGEAILMRKFEKLHGRKLDLQNTRTFTEKLFRRMILLNRRNNPTFTMLADKYAARAWVAAKIGEEYLVKLLWHGTDPGRIPFDTLPHDYVIKTNHASGQVILVRGQPDKDAIIAKLRVWLKTNIYWLAREYHYYFIKPRVMVEEFLRTADGSPPLDYRFWCFAGVPEVIQVDDHAHSINPFYDTRWNHLDMSYRKNFRPATVKRPDNLEEMLSIAGTLSRDFDFVRVDLYNIDGRIYFGEMTFTPVAGRFRFQPDHWDLYLGEKWKLGA